MKILRWTPCVPTRDPVATAFRAAVRDDVANLTVFEKAVRAIFVAANGLDAYYRTYYSNPGNADAVVGSRKGDRRKAVKRGRGAVAAALAGSPPALAVRGAEDTP